MEQFIDREAELAWLREGWAEDRPQFRILFGRRRVGKSALLDRFARGMRAIVYQAVEGTVGDQLRDLTAAVLACADDPVLRAAPLANWGQALATFARLAREGPLLVILDEYQYAAEADPTLASQLQRWWSRDVGALPIYLVLCGSYIRFFVQNVLTGPAYGRNTGSLQLRPLGYRQAAAFFPGWSHEDHVRAFAVTGGMPHYILQLYPDRSLEWNIVHRMLGRGAVLYREAELLVREELREPRLYFSILRAIADGHTRAHEIAVHMGARSEITPYIWGRAARSRRTSAPWRRWSSSTTQSPSWASSDVACGPSPIPICASGSDSCSPHRGGSSTARARSASTRKRSPQPSTSSSPGQPSRRYAAPGSPPRPTPELSPGSGRLVPGGGRCPGRCRATRATR